MKILEDLNVYHWCHLPIIYLCQVTDSTPAHGFSTVDRVRVKLTILLWPVSTLGPRATIQPLVTPFPADTITYSSACLSFSAMKC